MSEPQGLWTMTPEPIDAEKLTDALRELLVKAWDEGNKAGADDQARWDGWGYEPGYREHKNPYREGEADA